MSTEADTCRKYITPALQAAGWDDTPHSIAEQRTFTDGRVVPVGDKIQRLQQKRADYLLRYTRDFTLAVVEAKAEDHDAAEGMQQAREYADITGTRIHRIKTDQEVTTHPRPPCRPSTMCGGAPQSGKPST
jgi:type I restriction enzyme R subunit